MGSNHSSVRSPEHHPSLRPTATGSSHSPGRSRQHHPNVSPAARDSKHPSIRPTAMGSNFSLGRTRQHHPTVLPDAMGSKHSSGRSRQHHTNVLPMTMGSNHNSVRSRQHNPHVRSIAVVLNHSSVRSRQHHPKARPPVMGSNRSSVRSRQHNQNVRPLAVALNQSSGRPCYPVADKGAAESCKYSSAFTMRQRPAGPLCPWASSPLCLTSPAVSVIRERCLPQFVRLLHDRTLVFIGDSLSRQHFYAFACDLWAYAARELEPGGRSARYVNICNGELSTKAFHERQTQAAQCSHCCNHHCLVFGRVRICFVLGSKRTTPSLNLSSVFPIVAARLKPSDIIVANIGVHWGPTKLEALTRALLNAHNALATDARPLLIWRESGPQHYLGGEYLPSRDGIRSRTECTPFTAQTYALPSFNFRNRMTNSLMNASGVPILQIFNASSANFASHLNPGRDCTHWCFDGRAGSGVLSMWNYRLFTLLRRSAEGTASAAAPAETNVAAAADNSSATAAGANSSNTAASSSAIAATANSSNTAASSSATAATASGLVLMQEWLCNALAEEYAWPSSWPSRAFTSFAPCRLTQKLGEAWKVNKSLWRVQEA